MKHHKVFDVMLGRSEASLRSYLKRLPGKENVRGIVMDLSETYRRIAQEYFPNAMQEPGLLSLMRRHHWKLSSVQKERLHQYLAQESVLQALYFAKQQLNGFLVMKSLKTKRAKQLLPKFLALIRQFEQSPARALAATLQNT
ncbi:transposase [Alcaligenaceae bacterium]|nr:transposase [Alcaligenaceae bacterium]